MTIDYSQITSVEVVQRQVTAMEGLLGGLNAAHLNQPTNLNIQYKNETGADLLLRVGMLSGVTVMGQAVRCTELLDLLRVTGILSKFAKPQVSSPQQFDIPEQIEKLAGLMNKGILTKEEFELKKSELIKRM